MERQAFSIKWLAEQGKAFEFNPKADSGFNDQWQAFLTAQEFPGGIQHDAVMEAVEEGKSTGTNLMGVKCQRELDTHVASLEVKAARLEKAVSSQMEEIRQRSIW